MKQQHESVNVWFAARITRPTSGGFEMVGESEREREEKLNKFFAFTGGMRADGNGGEGKKLRNCDR